jgi:hypothetical protein
MTKSIHHQADPPGVTLDVTLDGHRYIFIEEGPATDCGYTGSREFRYNRRGCRCDTCRIARSAAVRRRAARRQGTP